MKLIGNYCWLFPGNVSLWNTALEQLRSCDGSSYVTMALTMPQASFHHFLIQTNEFVQNFKLLLSLSPTLSVPTLPTSIIWWMIQRSLGTYSLPTQQWFQPLSINAVGPGESRRIKVIDSMEYDLVFWWEVLWWGKKIGRSLQHRSSA